MTPDEQRIAIADQEKRLAEFELRNKLQSHYDSQAEIALRAKLQKHYDQLDKLVGAMRLPTPNHQPNNNMPNDIENTAGSDCPAATCSGDAPDFITELRDLLNRRSMENGSDTPDFILAQYLTDCLRAWNRSTKRREDWYGRTPQEVSPPNSTCQP